MFQYEMMKYYLNKFFLILFGVCIALKVLVSWSVITVNPPYSDLVYREYMEAMDGMGMEEAKSYLEEEQERLDQAVITHEETSAAYEMDEISFEEFEAANDTYIYAQAQQPAYEAIVARYEYYLENEIDGIFFYELDIAAFYNSLNTDFVMVLLICVMVAFSYALEERSENRTIIRTCANGREQFDRCKLWGILTNTLVLAVLFAAIDLIVYGVKYSFAYWGMNSSNVQVMAGFPLDLPVAVVFVLILLIRIVICLLASVINSVIAVRVKKTSLTIFITILLWGIPMLLLM